MNQKTLKPTAVFSTWGQADIKIEFTDTELATFDVLM